MSFLTRPFLARSIITSGIQAVERLPLPDAMLRAAVASLISRNPLPAEPCAKADAQFADAMRKSPIAVHTADANRQHYELPAEFFQLVLGPRRKYSCCYYDGPDTTLADAELRSLDITMARAGLADGQRILELGCGWGSLSLEMAERFPNARITAVSNSHSQRRFIESQVRARGLANLDVVTANMADFRPTGRFDRIVSVEMLEHIANWPALFSRVAPALEADGSMLVHVFSHRARAYRFDHDDPTDWIARHFFTGGLMPSDGLMRQFSEHFAVEDEWRWSGSHYARTARDWLANFDNNEIDVSSALKAVYGADTPLWHRRWRLFFLAVEGLFGHSDGAEWGVKHYRLRRP